MLEIFQISDSLTKENLNELSTALVWHSVTPECTEHDHDENIDNSEKPSKRR